ncbi:hypothetical protein BASA61_004764 [Batrachochytrium salamandrivorans]|nr:hypothetical protein BASA61_004764 [Batrachochytrium salamandrivorans]
MGDSSGSEALQESRGQGIEPALTQDHYRRSGLECNPHTRSRTERRPQSVILFVIKLDEYELSDEINARCTVSCRSY